MFCDIFLPICLALLFTEIAFQPADNVIFNEVYVIYFFLWSMVFVSYLETFDYLRDEIS